MGTDERKVPSPLRRETIVGVTSIGTFPLCRLWARKIFTSTSFGVQGPAHDGFWVITHPVGVIGVENSLGFEAYPLTLTLSLTKM